MLFKYAYNWFLSDIVSESLHITTSYQLDVFAGIPILLKPIVVDVATFKLSPSAALPTTLSLYTFISPLDALSNPTTNFCPSTISLIVKSCLVPIYTLASVGLASFKKWLLPASSIKSSEDIVSLASHFILK